MAHRSHAPVEPLVLKRRLMDQSSRYWWLWLLLMFVVPLLLVLLIVAGVWPGATDDPEAWAEALELLWDKLNDPESRRFWWQTALATALSAVSLWATATVLPQQRLILTADTLSWRLPLPSWLPINTAGWTIKLTDITAAKLVKPPFGSSGGAMSHLELTVKRFPRVLQPMIWVPEDYRENERPGLLATWKLLRKTMTNDEHLRTPLCAGLIERGVHIDDLPVAHRPAGFRLESNPATLAVTVAVGACLVYTPLDLMFYGEHYATEPPFGWMVICGLVACGLAGAYLANSDVPKGVAIGLAMTFGVTAGAASAPGMLRVNAMTDDVGLQTVTYYKVAANRFKPRFGGDWPDIELPQPSYWFLQEEGTEREIHIRRGGLGIYQINLDNINAELRSYFQGQRAKGGD